MSFSRAAQRALIGGAVAAALIVAPALPATAHVTINPDTAEPGGYGAFSIRVPNEEDNADTTKVQLYLPTDHPIASVSVQPTPGWAFNVTNGKLPKPIKTDDGEITRAITKITWSGGNIAPGEFQQFVISLGPLPTDTPKLYFTALQTYTDKSGKESVVRWSEMPKGGAEPEHPAPSITLAKAAVPPVQAAASKAKGGSDGTATIMGVLGLVAGLLGLAAGIAAFVRSGRSSSA
jgi:uncharacterized protein YcnI